MSLAPNYDVPEGVSPFVPLPVLELCSRCHGPVHPFQLMAVRHGDRFATGLCPTCASALDAEWAAA